MFTVDNVNETPFDCYTPCVYVNNDVAANANVATAGSGFALIKSLKADFNGLMENNVNNINMDKNLKNLFDFNDD